MKINLVRWGLILLLGVGTGITHAQNETNYLEMNNSIANQNKQSTKAFFTALEEKNIDSLIALFTEDAKHINPYASGLFPEGATGKTEIKTYWTPVFENFGDMFFPIDEIYAMEDPTIVFVKFKGKIALTTDQGFYENDYYATFKFNKEGLITEYVEIFNPIIAAKGFGLIDKIK